EFHQSPPQRWSGIGLSHNEINFLFVYFTDGAFSATFITGLNQIAGIGTMWHRPVMTTTQFAKKRHLITSIFLIVHPLATRIAARRTTHSLLPIHLITLGVEKVVWIPCSIGNKIKRLQDRNTKILNFLEIFALYGAFPWFLRLFNTFSYSS